MSSKITQFKEITLSSNVIECQGIDQTITNESLSSGIPSSKAVYDTISAMIDDAITKVLNTNF